MKKERNAESLEALHTHTHTISLPNWWTVWRES